MEKFLSNKAFLGILILASLSITLYCQWPELTNKYIVHDDVTQYIPGVYAKLHLIEGAENDLVLKYIIVKNSPGHLWLFVLLGSLIDPLLLIKIFPFILFLLSVLFLYYYGVILKNKIVGFFSALLFAFYLWSSECTFFAGTNPRAFVFPLFLIFLIFLHKKQYFSCLCVLILQTLFYPIITVTSLILFFLHVFFLDIKHKKTWIWLITSAVICFTIAYICYRVPNSFLGELIPLNEIRQMPEYQLGGRHPFFVNNLSYILKSERISGIDISKMFTIMFGASILSFLIILKDIKKIPKSLFIIILSGIIGCFLSNLLLFKLFFPGRYLLYTLPLFMALLIAFAIEKVYTQMNSHKFAYLLIPLLSILIIGVGSHYLVRDLTNYEKSYFTFLDQLPKSCLIAGHPYEMDPIPLFFKRKIFIQFETSTAWYTNYYHEVKERTRAFFAAYYSSSLSELEQFMQRYKIDYLLVSREHFSDKYIAEKDYYIKPFNQEIESLLAKNKHKFVLMTDAVKSDIVYDDGINYFIIKRHID